MDTHVHTTKSDGKLPPEKVLELYADAGYDAVAITDHDTFAVPTSVPKGLIWIPGEEFTVAADPLPFYPPKVPKWVRMWYHVVCLGIKRTIKSIKQLTEVPLTIHAHPYTTHPKRQTLPLFFDAMELLNGANKCAFGLIGRSPPRYTGGSDGHGTEMAPYAVAGCFVFAEKNVKSIIEGIRKGRIVAFCRNLFIAPNLTIALKFWKDTGIRPRLVQEFGWNLALQPKFALDQSVAESKRLKEASLLTSLLRRR